MRAVWRFEKQMENTRCDSWTELFSIVTATVPEICSDDLNKPMQELDICV